MPSKSSLKAEQTTNSREQSGAEALNDALALCLERDPSTLLIGEGVPDPMGIFGTTTGLRDRFGAERVLDMPLSENGLTGICIGAAISGLRPIMVHQRIDFALLAMDQLVNNAAKWRYMFAGQASVPLVVRCIVGRGWGQGPQHAQSLQSLFAHIPGLKVVMPVFPDDAKGMLCAAVADDDPVIFIEHRWIHPVRGEVPDGYFETPLGKARVRREGRHITIAAFSFMTIEALHAARALANLGIEAEVIDMRSVSPLDVPTVLRSVAKTGHLLVADTGHQSFGVAGELISRVVRQGFDHLTAAPVSVTLPDLPCPTSHVWAAHYYPTAVDIAEQALRQCGISIGEAEHRELEKLLPTTPPDIPNPDYRGPF
ncbi:MAG: alpha-ketoacid dehydrogenase subunit beta [Gammaproteobacteria bacterium]|nr:alpha-ketoacid dehydrogenase subunit beta [Gammaproteobacteria bacterium]